MPKKVSVKPIFELRAAGILMCKIINIRTVKVLNLSVTGLY